MIISRLRGYIYSTETGHFVCYRYIYIIDGKYYYIDKQHNLHYIDISKYYIEFRPSI